jgi:hypothetical protein
MPASSSWLCLLHVGDDGVAIRLRAQSNERHAGARDNTLWVFQEGVEGLGIPDQAASTGSPHGP